MKRSGPSTQIQIVPLRAIAFPVGVVQLEWQGEKLRKEFLASLHEGVRQASPGFFFDRVIPVNLRDLPPPSRLREFSALKAHLWREYIKGLQAPAGSAELRTLIEGLQTRQEAAVEDWQRRGWRARPYDLRLTHRMVIGLGRASVWETGMTWHRPTGLPYIPASAIKGIVRGWRMTQVLTRYAETHLQAASTQDRIARLSELDDRIARQTQPPEDLPPEIRQDLQTVYRWFGSTESRGLVTFLDAFPTEPPGFELDVMNVHYPEYYRGDAPEALDIESPNPVVFLTVARTPFRFWILVDALRAGQEADRILDAVGQALAQALQVSGIGGKTRLGYGRFKGK
jgi:CRISPR-associated protein Cmr6